MSKEMRGAFISTTKPNHKKSKQSFFLISYVYYSFLIILFKQKRLFYK